MRTITIKPFSLFVWILGNTFGISLIFLLLTPAHADPPLDTDISAQATFPSHPLITPANGTTSTNLRPTFDWDDAEGGIISYTLVITGHQSFTGPNGPTTTASITTTGSTYTPDFSLSNGVYAWTIQAHNGAEVSGYVSPAYTFTVAAARQIFLPLVMAAPPGCPPTSSASFDLIPFVGARADHPDYLHGDLNLSLRGYAAITAALDLVDYAGAVDPNAPQLAGLFGPNRFPGISTVYQVNNWIWGCGEHGCRGSAITNPEVTLGGLITTPGEAIHIPERAPNIYSGVYKALVLYAEERRITLGYTREDTVSTGYAVQIENVCVDPNLLALYRAQTDAGGWHVTGHLPALRNDQSLGTAFGTEIQVAVRDRGSFMDPRSRKDWWWGY